MSTNKVTENDLMNSVSFKVHQHGGVGKARVGGALSPPNDFVGLTFFQLKHFSILLLLEIICEKKISTWAFSMS